MALYDCDRCGTHFEAEPTIRPDGEGRATCPTCGDVRRITLSGSSAGAPHANAVPSARAAAPAQRGSVADERTLLVVRPALFRAYPLTYGGLVLLAFAGVVLTILPLFTLWAAWASLVGMALFLVAAIAFVRLFVFSHRWFRLKVTDRRTVDERGIVARRHSEVLHEHAVNIRITQGVWQRLMRIGDIEIESAAGDVIDISIHAIPDPYGVKAIIDRYRR